MDLEVDPGGTYHQGGEQADPAGQPGRRSGEVAGGDQGKSEKKGGGLGAMGAGKRPAVRHGQEKRGEFRSGPLDDQFEPMDHQHGEPESGGEQHCLPLQIAAKEQQVQNEGGREQDDQRTEPGDGEKKRISQGGKGHGFGGSRLSARVGK